MAVTAVVVLGLVGLAALSSELWFTSGTAAVVGDSTKRLAHGSQIVAERQNGHGIAHDQNSQRPAPHRAANDTSPATITSETPRAPTHRRYKRLVQLLASKLGPNGHNATFRSIRHAATGRQPHKWPRAAEKAIKHWRRIQHRAHRVAEQGGEVMALRWSCDGARLCGGMGDRLMVCALALRTFLPSLMLTTKHVRWSGDRSVVVDGVSVGSRLLHQPQQARGTRGGVPSKRSRLAHTEHTDTTAVAHCIVQSQIRGHG